MSDVPHRRSPSRFAGFVPTTRSEFTGIGRSAARAWRGPGRERDLVVQSLKAAFAAVLSWFIAGWWLRAPMAIMAPWVAIVLVQATVYRSVAHASQILLSMTLGTLLAALSWWAFGSTIGAMAAVLPVTMLIGNWRRFGDQGGYSSTSALFVLSYGPVSAPTVGHRLTEALLGAVIGVGVNLLLWPPVHLRDSHRAVEAVAGESCEILRDAADGLRRGWDTGDAAMRHRRALRAFRRWEDLRQTTGRAHESLRLNPRRRSQGPVPALDQGIIPVLERVVTRVSAITRTLRDAAREDGAELTPDGAELAPYAAFLEALAQAVSAYGAVDGDAPDPAERRRRLRDALGEARRQHEVLAERLPKVAATGPRAMALTGSLLAEAGRLLADLEETDPGEPG